MATRRTPRGGAQPPEPDPVEEAAAPQGPEPAADKGLAGWLLYSTTFSIVVALILVLLESGKYS